ncbi:hypothetical protein J4E81_008099 [Alternaria sp. BMP 2799]|nr:hypothetical protein J4E81_008099 [Alternaria sp. BMP 2799]
MINRKAGGIRIPAIVDLSDGEPSPELEYEMVEYAVQNALAKERGLPSGNTFERKTPMSTSSSKSPTSQRKRRFIVDSDDDDSTSSTPSPSSSQKYHQKERSIRSVSRNTKRRRDSFLSDSDSDAPSDQPVRKAKKPRQDLAAELDDLDIEMEGWSAAEETPKRQRRGR